jgi:cytoskeleton protein RodZ
MNESVIHDQQVNGACADEPVWSAPVLLRQAREAAGLHIAALAAALKVPVKKLEALEAGRYDELPDLTFARALASSACRQLKTDPGPILEQIPQGHMPVLGDSRLTINAPFKGDQGASTFSPQDWLRRPAVLIASLALLGALLIALVPDWNALPGKDLLTGATGVFSSDPTTGKVVTTVVPPAPDSDSPDTSAVSQVSTVTDVLAAPAPGAPVDPVLAQAPVLPDTPPVALAEPVASGSLLILQATSDSWVEVIDGTGKVQVQRILKAGDALNFSSPLPYSVVLGRADAVQVQVRGRPFDVTPFARNSVARFEVK